MKIISPYIVLLFVISLPLNALAQYAGFPSAYTTLGFGARAMGMGNAVSSSANDGIYPFYNPALAASITKRSVEFSSAVMPYDRAVHYALFNYRMPPDAGISISLINATVKNIDLRSQSGYHIKNQSTNDFEAATSFGVRATPNFHVGISLKFIYANYHPEVPASFGFGLDIGSMYRINDFMQLSFSIHDIIKANRWSTNDLYGTQNSDTDTDNFPIRYKMGLSYSNKTNTLLITGEFEAWSWNTDYIKREAGFDFGTSEFYKKSSIVTSESGLRSGIRYRIHPRLSLRTGYQLRSLKNRTDSGSFSAGFSLYLPFDALSPSIHYAFVQEPNGFSNFHVFSLSLTF